MYTIYVDGSLLYSPNLADDGFGVLEPKIRMTLNTADSFECRIPTSNPLYGHISKLKSVVKVYDGNTRIFRGRVIDDRRDARVAMLEANPSLSQMYSADDGVMEVFYLKNATAAICSFTGAPEAWQF